MQGPNIFQYTMNKIKKVRFKILTKANTKIAVF